MSDDIVRKYLLFRFDAGKDWQTVNSDYSAIQKWFKNVLMLSWSLTKLPRARKEKKLPFILSKEDVVKIIEAEPPSNSKSFSPLSTSQVRDSARPFTSRSKTSTHIGCKSDQSRQRQQGPICDVATEIGGFVERILSS
ncbi:MAG: hypothetical protein IPJ13_01870 [Saprospiraceae bacterium]|nr:hypothetical protein [Saprospiraceae bacterium]